MIERWWAELGDYVHHLLNDPVAQGIAGTLAVGALVLFVIIRET